MKNNLAAFVAACAGMFLFGVTLITLGSVATGLKAKFQLDGIAAGTLFSILPFGILAGSLIFGPVCDRFGYKLLLILACIGMFAGFEGIAFSNSLGILKISVFVFGLGGGIINGATNAVVADISPEHKGANLSLLGVFFGLGALGMPLVLGMLSKNVSSFNVVAAVGWLTLAVAIFYLFIPFPPAKQNSVDGSSWKSLLKLLLLFIAFFLFFQSSFEAIINNWATTYVTTKGIMGEQQALFALSLHIIGMVAMRLLAGSILRKVSEVKIMWACLVMLALGVALMKFGNNQTIVVAGLIFSGAGLAGGFPLMLGITGKHFPHLSGTAFSLIFTVALIGNMLINYLMGVIVHRYGVLHLTTVAFIEVAVMTLLFYFIIKQLKTTK
ncbi:MAG TPA: MFS transporter [Flavisolibacter sp.]|jgi:MFS family permease|nr:MFS transporter [Flavisolibacter sp.]